MYIGGDGGVIDLTRKVVLDDTIGPEYLWKDDELIHYLNIIYEELYSETLLVEDRTTLALTQLKLLSNLGIYDLSDLVLNVKEGAKLSVNTNRNHGVLKRSSEAYLDQLRPSWREVTDTVPQRYLPECGRSSLEIYPKFKNTGEVVGASNIKFTLATKKIFKPGEDFTAHYAVGDEINISGTTLNNGYVTAAVVTATEITTNEALADESLTSATLRKVCDTLLMVVNRLPLVPFTVADITASPAVTPEIKTMYHRELIYGIGREAFLKEDTQTLDLQASDRNGKRFEAFKAKVKKDLAFLNRSERQGSSGRSGIWKSY
jgi:hypothetical protein